MNSKIDGHHPGPALPGDGDTKLGNTLAAVAISQATGVAPAIGDQLPAKFAGTYCLVSNSADVFSTYQRMRKRWGSDHLQL